MIEKAVQYTRGDSKVIEQVINREAVMINHMILPQGEALPEHEANSKVYMTVIRGEVSLRLDDQAESRYPEGTIVQIPMRTKMNVFNQAKEVLELIVIKAPGPEALK